LHFERHFERLRRFDIARHSVLHALICGAQADVAHSFRVAASPMVTDRNTRHMARAINPIILRLPAPPVTMAGRHTLLWGTASRVTAPRRAPRG
jgi:hypothetical protein